MATTNVKVKCSLLNKSSAPSYRGGSSITCNYSIVYQFGGADRNAKAFNDLNYSNIDENKWNSTPSSSIPKPRSGHSINTYKNYLIVFGGLSQDGNTFNDIYVYNLDKKEWVKAGIVEDSVNQSPYPRNSHSSVLFKDKLFIFGGSNGTEGPLNDLWNLDLSKIDENVLEWKCLFKPNELSFPVREMHSSCIINDENNTSYLLIHGGRTINGELLSDILLYNIEKNEWLPRFLTSYPRCSHVINNFSNHLAGLFGGLNDKMEVCNDVEVLTIKEGKCVFNTVECVGELPNIRFGHCGCNYRENEFLIFGGINFEEDLNVLMSRIIVL